MLHVRQKSRDTVEITWNKVVDGEEVAMGGTVDFHLSGSTLTYDMAARDGSKAVVTLTRDGDHMAGTLKQVPAGEVIRNISVKKE